jgi:hypothetical protein
MPVLKIFICQGDYFHWENDIILVLKSFWISINFFFFAWLFYFNLNKIAEKWEKFTNFSKPQNNNKKPWSVGGLPLDNG